MGGGNTVRGMARRRNMARLGERREVLVEKAARKGGDLLQARSRDFRTVMVPAEAAAVRRLTVISATRPVKHPVSVATIREAGRAGVRMPEKTTFFWPKPRTGMVMRRLDD